MKPPPLVLPAFGLLHKQPDPPHVARTVATCQLDRPGRAPLTVEVKRDRNGKRWYAYAVGAGLRMSDTITTGVPEKGQAWVEAVNACRVRIAEAGEAVPGVRPPRMKTRW